MTTKISGDNISAIANTGVTWNAVTVADGSTQLNASAGNGYFLDTNTGVIEVYLPSSPTRGDTVILMDYAGTFATNNVLVNTGTTNLDSTTTGIYKLETNDTIAEFVYVDSAKGWVTRINTTTGTTPTGALVQGQIGVSPSYTVATGGTITTSGDYKIHSFTGDGCFVVSTSGNSPLFPCNPLAGPSVVDYLVVAGGGGGGLGSTSGGGAGGYRESHSTCNSGPYTASPLATPTGITVSTQTYPISVGAGGAGSDCAPANGSNGSNSIFSTITSAGGGGGGSDGSGAGSPGGSGGGGANGGGPGSGNTPPVSPPQGNNGGGSSGGTPSGGGGGGAGAAGGCQPSNQGIAGGAGVGTLINPATGETGPGPSQYYAGGGASGSRPGTFEASGGIGGGGNGGSCDQTGTNGTANTGGGGGSGQSSTSPPWATGRSGGKGIVIIRYKYQ
jgi:hypothetical protein